MRNATTTNIAECIGCQCTDVRACVVDGTPCSWLRVDRTEGRGVCSCCREQLPAWDATHKPHELDDDSVCIHCGHDAAEAAYYSRRGYAHEYAGSKYCTGRP